MVAGEPRLQRPIWCERSIRRRRFLLTSSFCRWPSTSVFHRIAVRHTRRRRRKCAELHRMPCIGRHTRIKQYLKDGRALRIETVINDSYDLSCPRRLAHLDELLARARAVNAALLDTERIGQGCVLASPAFERIAQPTLTEDGSRAPGLRFGALRVQALAGALCTSVLAVTGITNKRLRALMTGLLGGSGYTMNQASYDLGGLRDKGLITRIPGHNQYRTHSTTGCGSRSSTPNSTTGYYGPCSPPISRQRRHPYERPCAPSTFTSQKPSTKRDSYRTPPKHSRQLSKS